MSLPQRLSALRKELGSATLVAVSKSVGVQRIKDAYDLGQRDFGENRVEDLEKKALYCSKAHFHDIRWHFLGRLSTKKFNRLLNVPRLKAIHSVDSLPHLKGLSTRAHHLATPPHLYLQVNASNERQKAGFTSREEVEGALSWAQSHDLGPLNIVGLMTMGAQGETDGKSFQRLKALRDQIDPTLKLSMGMSADYKVALNLGSDILRIGTFLWS